MAIYRVQAPDGSILELEGPDNATPEQIGQAAQAAFAQRQAQRAPAAAPVQPYTAPPSTRPPEPTRAPTVGEQLVGAGETALTLLTGATAPVTMAAGTLGGLAGAILRGEFGTPEAAREVERVAQETAARFIYQPRGQAGQRMVQAVGETLQEVLPPVLPQIAQPGMAMQAAAQQAPLVTATAGRAAAAAAPAVRTVAQAPVRAVQAVRQTTGMAPAPAPASPAGAALQRGAAGASGVTVGGERVAVAEMMPVPFTGPSALTAGQASRNFAQLQFEKEAAKMGDLGAPLRERVEMQTANMIRNFDALIDLPQPVAADPRAIGMGVDRALVNRVEVKRREIRSAYDKAEAAGEMEGPVELQPLAVQLEKMRPLEGLNPTIAAVRAEAIRLGALAPDENGNLVPRPISLKDTEVLRQFVNENTDWGAPRDRTHAGAIKAAIDTATEGKGGELYKSARALHEKYSNEFENVGLTAQLLGTKRGTSERQIAYADVFDKIIVLSPVEEMNKLRSTLLRAGPEGRQSWNDLKAGGVRFIKESALSPSQRDASGNPLLSPDKLQRTVRALDQDGKLEALYGKRQAQVLRDLAELSSDIYTAPPGAVNTSNTASALQVALDSFGTWAVTGIPGPAATTLREASKYVKNRKTRARIEAALRGQITAGD